MPAYKELENVEMTAFCNRNIEKALEAKEKFGTPDALVTSDYGELLKSDVDAVIIATSNLSHSEIAVAALNAKKHVMCEKPMAITKAQSDAMIKAAEDNGMILCCSYQSRFQAQNYTMKEYIKTGALGNIYFGKAKALRRRGVPTWGSFLNKEIQGGGPLIDIGTHVLDLILWEMDNYEPLYCVGSTYQEFKYQKNTANWFGDWDSEKYEIEDSGFGFIVMKNGATIILESSWALNSLDNDDGKILICGSLSGVDNYDGFRINGVENSQFYTKKPELYQPVRPEVMEALNFINSILGKEEPVCPGKQAGVVVDILEGIYESARTNKPYYFK